MDLGLKGKNAIVTGGSQGVGFAIAQGLAREDCNVALGARGKDKLDKAAKEGKGAAQLDGRMIDAASARMAENIVNIDKLINNK